MFEITKGYKQGRAVMYYDLLDPMEGKTQEQVPKLTVVQLCNEGQVSNATIQMWEGKPIVRVKSNIPLMKLGDNGEVLGYTEKVIRNTGTNTGSTKRVHKEEVVNAPMPSSKVMGKVNPRKAFKENTAFTGYDRKHMVEHQELNKEVNYKGMKTLNDLFNVIAADFGAHDVELYRSEVSKKIKLDRDIEGINRSELLSIQNSIAMYIMNMVYGEIQKTYLKYMVKMTY